ncbi:MAG: DUF1552 domain-containing protein [Planctomycetota bacterium]|nr:DUF1552 domain-containing protein [Planctomycetota bacterium]
MPNTNRVISAAYVPPKRISRRHMLIGGSTAIGLPLMNAMQPALAGTRGVAEKSTTPVRLCYLYFPNGAGPNSWEPEKTESSGKLLKLGKWMSPLEGCKKNILILRRTWTPRGNGHGAGTATWLTGGGYDERKVSAGVSADQIAAKSIGKDTMFPSIELSMEGEGFFSNSLPRNTISWNEKGYPIPRETEPRSIFDRMFRSQTGAANDRSTIDQAFDEIRRLKRTVGAQDNRKLDEYLEAIRSVERRMEFAQKNSERANQNPELRNFLKRPKSGIPQNHGQYMKLMYDMIALAFWSDATRVSSLMLDHGQSNRYFNFIDGVKGTWHAISHWRDTSGKTEDDDGVHSWDSTQEKLEMYNRILQWHHEQFAYFLERLRTIQENDRSLIDQCGILYGSSLSDGHAHSARNLPIIVAGNAGGQFNTGRLIKFKQNTSLSGIHLSLLRAASVPVKRFAEATSPIDFSS